MLLKPATRATICISIAATVCLAVFFLGIATAQMLTAPSLLSRHAHTQFRPEVIRGRIVGRSLRVGNTQVNMAGERLAVQPSAEPGHLELVYQGRLREEPFRDKKLSLILDTTGRLEIECCAEANETSADKTPADSYMHFVQKPGEPIVFTIGRDPKGRSVRAGTIWKLLLGYPEECRRYLVPILYKLRPGWGLLLDGERVKTELLKIAGQDHSEHEAAWRELVEQLGDKKYARREAADRRLRQAGRRAVAFLRNLDKNKLDAEQRLRVDRIIDTFGDQEQSPREVAYELRRDPDVWLALARSDEEQVRSTAKEELQRLLKAPVDFDPKADLEVRCSQLEKIGQLIESR